MRLVNCDSVEAYVDEVMSASQRLAAIGFKVDDSWLAGILLMGLPEHYEPMIMGLEASGKAMSADAVKAKILQDVKVERGPRCSNEDGAFYSSSRNFRAKDDARKSKGPKACFKCNKVGHFANKCPENANQKGRKQKGLCCIFAMGDVMTKEWYFDSGATSHMARSDQNFTNEVPMNHGVGTANSSSMMTVAKGSVLLNTSEGEVNVDEVLKIPELATNLLSVSAICKRGNKMVFTANKCEVWSTDGELVVTGVEDGWTDRRNRCW